MRAGSSCTACRGDNAPAACTGSRAGPDSPAVYGRSRLDERPDLLRIGGRGRIVDHQAEIGPAIDGKGGVFERDHAGFRVPNTLGAFVCVANIMVAPHRREFGALAAEL